MELRDHLQSTLGDAYVVERELGGGGMARVFVARDVHLGRRVVIKTLAPEFAAAVSVDRFRREIRLAASLQQANIVPVHTAGDTDGLPFYTMPFVEGETLRERIVRSGRLGIQETVGVVRDIARALAFAHARGIVHRDIKPENVLLSGSAAVVTDFGIAKALAAALGDGPGAEALTVFGTALGTPAYMAPEQAAGDSDVDHRADLYALGVVAYELLVGAPPFAGRTTQALIAAHIVEEPVAIGDKRNDVPAPLASLIMHCLAKDPALRPDSADAILAALDTPAAEGIHSAAAVISAKVSNAIMPFVNVSPESSDELFADGLTDEIITDLSPIRALHVIARASMMRFKQTTKDPETVARELKVRYVLDGTVRRAGTSLRVTARLLDASDGSVVWADKLGGSVEDVFAVQEQISRTIVDSLRLKLTPREARHLTERPIQDLRAYEYFLQARQAMWTFSLQSLDRAVQLLDNALEIVGENPRLLAALGNANLLTIETGQVDAAERIARAEDCARRLALIESDSFDIHWLEGSIRFRRGDIRDAIRSFERAMELDPNSADAAALLAYAYLLAGRGDRARWIADLLVALDPLTPLFQCLPGMCDLMVGRYDAAIMHYRRFFDMDGANPAAHFFLAWVLAMSGRKTEAIVAADALAATFPTTVFGQLGHAYALAVRGDLAGARAAMTAEMKASATQSEMFARLVADLHAQSGDLEAAVDAITAAANFGFANYPYLAEHAVLLAPIRDHPRYLSLLDDVRVRWERGGASVQDNRPSAPSPAL